MRNQGREGGNREGAERHAGPDWARGVGEQHWPLRARRQRK